MNEDNFKELLMFDCRYYQEWFSSFDMHSCIFESCIYKSVESSRYEKCCVSCEAKIRDRFYNQIDGLICKKCSEQLQIRFYESKQDILNVFDGEGECTTCQESMTFRGMKEKLKKLEDRLNKIGKHMILGSTSDLDFESIDNSESD